MNKNQNIPETKSLYDLYNGFDLSTDFFESQHLGFAILNLKNEGFKLPFESPPYRPEFYSFLFVKDGEGHYTIDNKSYDSNSSTIYFTNPSNYRTFGWNRIEEVYIITLDEHFLKKYINPNIYDVFPFLLTETINPKVASPEFYAQTENLYLQIHKEYTGQSQDKYNIIGYLMGVLLYRIKDYFWENYDPIYEGNRSSQIVKSFKRLLENHYRDVLAGRIDTVYKVQDYAEELHLNPSYLGSVIKSKTGKSISHWILDKCILEAKSLLTNTSHSIKEISYRLKFSEISHFSNYFKKHVGFSPLQYRKKKL